MNNIILLAATSAAAYWIYQEHKASQFYDAPMFSEQLRLLREQDKGLM